MLSVRTGVVVVVMDVVVVVEVAVVTVGTAEHSSWSLRNDAQKSVAMEDSVAAAALHTLIPSAPANAANLPSSCPSALLAAGINTPSSEQFTGMCLISLLKKSYSQKESCCLRVVKVGGTGHWSHVNVLHRLTVLLYWH